MSMTAIIYAAGRGLRLGPEPAKSPKILLRFGGRSLLDWHAQRLREAGVARLVIVTGYQRGQIAACLPGLRQQHGLEITEVVNPHFAEGSVLSFHASLPELARVDGPVLLMDGDVLYPTAMLQQLIHSPSRTALLIDREYSTADDDPVLVPIRGGRPIDFRKKWTGEADTLGESIGFFKVHSDDLPMLREETIRRSTGTGRADSYDDILRAMVLAGRFGHVDVTGLPWTEIDFAEDLRRAEKEILPAILRRGESRWAAKLLTDESLGRIDRESSSR